MVYVRLAGSILIGSLMILGSGAAVCAQTATEGGEFGPVVTSYLGYLRNEEEVVDDRANRREVTAAYYRRNSSRIKALRQMAIQIARATENDYLPELEAVTGDELRLLFEHPPQSQKLRVGEVIQTSFRYLGLVRSGETFFIFARLDPYEQAELLQKQKKSSDTAAGSTEGDSVSGVKVTTRSRRVSTPRL